MKKRQKLLTDEQWELVEPMLPPPKRRRDNRGRPWASNRACFRRHSVDSANRGSVAILAGRVSLAFDLLAAAQAVGRRRRLAECVAHAAGALDEEGLLKWDETFLDGSFAPAKKGALPSAKPSGARGRSGWYWSTVKVFRWEFGWKVPLRTKLHLRRPRSPKFRFRGAKAVPGKSRNG